MLYTVCFTNGTNAIYTREQLVSQVTAREIVKDNKSVNFKAIDRNAIKIAREELGWKVKIVSVY